jgi:hypothetical protein
MDAFVHREGYTTGAGECVSLAALYAAALFIVGRIPLEDIYMMATPLHSQNFVMVKDGILTNNRRLVTKNMWFNGTALSAQARRALENERVTIVSHVSGHIHTIYDDASISHDAYETFSSKLSAFLKTPLTKEILGNFLRQCPETRSCAQIRYQRNGKDVYISADKAFAYENGSPYRVTDNTRAKLMEDICAEAFELQPLPERIILNDLEDFITEHKIDIDNDADVKKLKDLFAASCVNAANALEKLIKFCHVKPRLPIYSSKVPNPPKIPLRISCDMRRDDIIAHIESIKSDNIIADLAFYAYRDLGRTSVKPYLKACLERNPVSIDVCRNITLNDVIASISSLPDESIYDESSRLAQPDEVWNFGRGDGLEKAVLLANIIYQRERKPLSIEIDNGTATLICGKLRQTFPTSKTPLETTWHYPAA